VTLFGIVLTPVFFHTIDWLGEQHLFASPSLRRASGLSLDLLRLGFLFRWFKTLTSTLGRRLRP
jgi:hypothetical protein